MRRYKVTAILIAAIVLLAVVIPGFTRSNSSSIDSNPYTEYRTWFYSSAASTVEPGQEITGSYLMEIPEDCYVYRILIKVSLTQKMICDGGVKVRLVPSSEDTRVAEYYFYRHGHITRPYDDYHDEYLAGVYDATEWFDYERGNWIYLQAGHQLQCVWSCYCHDSGGTGTQGFHCEAVLYTVLAD